MRRPSNLFFPGFFGSGVEIARGLLEATGLPHLEVT